ncbi:MAG: hypothetical protein LBH38_04170 [Holosporales bacterium]|jgi:putative ABC transport system permease protein|nr:hypothetical protein [Holosporales bacterium]
MISAQELLLSLEIGLIYGIVAIGIYITFRAINFPDMTCDGSFILGAVVSSVTIKCGYNPCLSIGLAFLSGGLSGFFTGILNIWLKIEDLLSGIIIAFMLYSISLRIMGDSPNITFIDEFTVFSGGKPLCAIATILFILVVFFIFILNTDFGLSLRAVGKNKKFISIYGASVNALIFTGLIASNAMIGMCGALFTQYQGFCDISQGTGTLVIGLASVIIGNTIFSFKSVFWSVPACVIGSVLYRVFMVFAMHSDSLGLKTQDLNLVTGILMITLTILRKRKCSS